jgi:ankyrin repeat protein
MCALPRAAAQGANVNLKGDEGKTALFHACRRGKTAIVGILLGSGAQVNAVDEEMKTVRSICVCRVVSCCVRSCC